MRTEINNILNDLKVLLGKNYGRFSNYQQLAPCVKEKLGNNIFDVYSQKQVSLDSARFDWLINQLELKNISVLEIGSNLGYFVLRLSSEFSLNIVAYEPVKEYAKATNLMAKLCNLEEKISCIASGIYKDDIKSIAKSDLIIHLNVLHHAGIEYDHNSLKKSGSWENYAIEYLSLLRKNGKRLFLQTGNISSGKQLFPMQNSIYYIDSLLSKSGWNTRSVGIIENFDLLKYSTYTSKEIHKIPVTKCNRNEATGLVDYYRNDELCVSLPTGLAARALWYCESNE